MTVFLSCVNNDFRDNDGPFANFRDRIRPYLTRGGHSVELEEEFHQAANEETLEKLDRYIENNDLVVHILACDRGSTPIEQEICSLKQKHLQKYATFSKQPWKFRKLIGDMKAVTYTEWEAYLALHHSKGLLIYLSEEHDGQFSNHLQRLEVAKPRKFPTFYRNREDLALKILADISRIDPKIIPENAQEKIQESRRFLIHWVLIPCFIIATVLSAFGINQIWEQWPNPGPYLLGYLFFSLVSIAIGFLIFYLCKRRNSSRIVRKEFKRLLRENEQNGDDS